MLLLKPLSAVSEEFLRISGKKLSSAVYDLYLFYHREEKSRVIGWMKIEEIVRLIVERLHSENATKLQGYKYLSTYLFELWNKLKWTIKYAD